ncbi:Hypothetical protein A7982_10000 [Minicystis rosea]|nr:Hypothetical protein A7982_10000 [Minicystis rosea]
MQQSDPQVLGQGSTKLWTLSAIPRIGYVFPLTQRIALWPRIGVGYAYTRNEERYDNGVNVVTSGTWIGGVDLKVVFQATKHLFFDVAPAFSLRYSRLESGVGTSSSVVAGVGGTVGMGVAL